MILVKIHIKVESPLLAQTGSGCVQDHWTLIRSIPGGPQGPSLVAAHLAEVDRLHQGRRGQHGGVRRLHVALTGLHVDFHRGIGPGAVSDRLMRIHFGVQATFDRPGFLAAQ